MFPICPTNKLTAFMLRPALQYSQLNWQHNQAKKQKTKKKTNNIEAQLGYFNIHVLYF